MNAIHGGGIGLYFDDAASTLVCVYLCNDVSIDVASYGGRGTGLRVPSTSSNNFLGHLGATQSLGLRQPTLVPDPSTIKST